MITPETSQNTNESQPMDPNQELILAQLELWFQAKLKDITPQMAAGLAQRIKIAGIPPELTESMLRATLYATEGELFNKDNEVKN